MGKRPKLKILLSSLIIVVALVALAVVPVMAQAPVGCAFEGELTVDGLPGDAGCLVRATVAGTGTTGTVATTVAGEYPWVMLVGTDADVDQVVTFEVQPAGSTVWLPAQTFVDGMPVVPLFVRYGHEIIDLVVGAGPTQVSLTMSVTGSGTTVPSGTTWYDVGDVVEISATPAMGWLFYDWTGDVTGSFNPTMVTMTTDMVVTANFVTEPPPPDCCILSWWLETL